MKKKIDRKISTLQPYFKDVLVCKDKKERPYLEVFVQEPENVMLENLGTIAGILEITDYSEDSSYIVNYLISVIKKEFFANPKRGAIESFEAALHKANLALAKLAEHGHVSWLGHLNSVCLVCEKNNIHLSQTGSAQAFLLRSQSLTNICEGEVKTGDPNPLKTFEDVVSGRLENDDRIIVTTDSIFNILSGEELKRSAIKFSEEKFLQFLKTALINELDRAAVLLLSIQEKKPTEAQPSLTIRKDSRINAFSQEAFMTKSKSPALSKETLNQEKKQEIVAELKKELAINKKNNKDKETGHIYLTDDEQETKKSSPVTGYMMGVSQKISQTRVQLTSSLKDIASKGYLSRVHSKISLTYYKERLIIKRRERQQQNLGKEISNEEGKSSGKKFLPKENFSNFWQESQKKLTIFQQKSALIISNVLFFGKAFWKNRIVQPLLKLNSLIAEKRAQRKLSKPEENVPTIDYSTNPESLSASREEKKQWLNRLSGSPQSDNPPTENTINFPFLEKQSFNPQKFLPDFSKIKSLISQMDYSKKAYAFILLILLFIVPYFIAKWSNKDSVSPEVPVAAVIPPENNPLNQEENVINIANINNIYSGNSILKIVNVRNQILVIEKDKITNLTSGNKNYSIPDNFQNPTLATNMDDLDLLLLVKDNKVLAFNAISGKFQDNNISIPTGKISAIGTYLTYLYLLDSQNNQIYRYPRAEGGFGEKTNWLKDSSVDFSQVKDIAINENVFLSNEKTITSFSRGKKQDFSLENTNTPIIPTKIFTQEDNENLYILDSSNARIIKVDKDGKILQQFYNTGLKDASNFAINEKNNQAYFSNDNEIKGFEMQQ